MAKQYTFVVDLSNGGTTPAYQVHENGQALMPVNNMPMLEVQDQVTFTFALGDRTIDWCDLYARPLVAQEALTPFSDVDGWKVQFNTVAPVSQTLTVAQEPGAWTFTLVGSYSTANFFGEGRISVPFLVDPEAEVGSGVG